MNERVTRQVFATGTRRDLSFVVSQGAAVSRARFFRDLRSVALPIGCGALLVALIYLVMVWRADHDQFSVTMVCLALLAIPLVTGAIFTALSRYEPSGTAGVGVVLTAFAFAVAILSAARLQLSYVALGVCMVLVVAIMSYVLVLLRNSRAEHVGLLNFPEAPEVLRRLGANAELVCDPDQAVADFDYVLIDAAAHHSQAWASYLTRCYMRGAEIRSWPQYLERRTGRVDVKSFDISHIVYSPSQILYSRLKRWVDVILIVLLAPAWGVLMIAVALYVRLRAGSPIIFKQSRKGHGGETFTMLKFRTMAHGSEGGATQSGDQRVVPGMGILRRLRLDELPQIFNILAGEMSLVGPRPVSSSIAETCEAMEPNFVNRLLVQPGLTGWAQVVSGYASNPEEEMEKLAYDLYYIKKMSFDFDMLILARTIRIVLFGTGAR